MWHERLVNCGGGTRVSRPLYCMTVHCGGGHSRGGGTGHECMGRMHRPAGGAGPTNAPFDTRPAPLTRHTLPLTRRRADHTGAGVRHGEWGANSVRHGERFSDAEPPTQALRGTSPLHTGSSSAGKKLSISCNQQSFCSVPCWTTRDGLGCVEGACDSRARYTV